MFFLLTKKRAFFFAILIAGLTVFSAQPVYAQNGESGAYQSAEKLFSEKSYQLALEQYQIYSEQPALTAEQKREAAFRIADCSWRSGNAELYAQASLALKQQVIAPDHDRWWAEANQSLAEFFIKNDRYSHQENIKLLLMAARDFWGSYIDAGLARPRFIGITFELAEYVSGRWGWQLESLANNGYPVRKEDDLLPVGENAGPMGIKDLMLDILKVADQDQDKAKAIYMLIMAYRNTYDDLKHKEADKYLADFLKAYSNTEWLDDVYYQAGQMYEQRQDCVKALEMYQALLARFKTGESQFVEDARQRIKDITSPVIQPGVGYSFLPNSPVRFSLRWRNVKEAEFIFYKIDLVDELRFDPARKAVDEDYGAKTYSDLLKTLVAGRQFERLPVALRFHRELKEEGKYMWSSADHSLAEWQSPEGKEIKPDSRDGVLAPGAYLLLVKSGTTLGYELVMVSDLGLVVKGAGNSALFYAFDTATGAPQANARVKYHYRYYGTRDWVWAEGDGVTDEQGLLRARFPGIERVGGGRQYELFAVLSAGARQAFSQGAHFSSNSGSGEYWLYAFTDRPAYRPNEQVSFKGTLRRYDGSAFTTPSGKQVRVCIYDARSTKVLDKVYTLNSFGSFNDSLILDENAALGEYRLTLTDAERLGTSAQATLFRLEEYKLPEFTVNIKPRPKGEGQFAGAYLLGDQLRLDLDVRYYFGGPAAKAKVEYLVYVRPDQHFYAPKKAYDWYYGASERYRNYYGDSQLLTKGNATTDAEGKALIEFATDKSGGQHLLYRVEARVVDESRREVQAVSEIKVSARSFYIYQTPRRNLYRPGDKAEIDVQAMTANNDPVAMEGKVTVSRNWWQDPLAKNRSDSSAVSLANERAGNADYQPEVLFSKFIQTDKKGQAVFEFTPEKNGYYSVAVTGFDAEGKPVESIANIYVCDQAANDIGYRYSGLQIIPEQDTYKVGDTMRLMLVADKPGANVLLSLEADELEAVKLVHMDGTVKLLELPVSGTYTPNIFVSALSPADQQIRMHHLELIVPPEEHFLNVKLSSEKPVYGPGEDGEFAVEVTNQNGQPVAVEMALSLVDASVFYIQSELVGDIRQFFFGNKRQHGVQTNSSLYGRPFLLPSPSALGKEEETGAGKPMIAGRYRSSGEDIGSVYAKKAEASSFIRNDQLVLSLEGKVDADKKVSLEMDESSGAVGENLATAQVRQDFRSTVFWGPSIITDEQGKARVSVKFPDPLTTWRATARVISTGTDIGNATYEVTTKKDIIVRLQAPRFFTERDRVTVSANVHNYTAEKQRVKVSLQAAGLSLEGEPQVWVDIEPQGEKRVDWPVVALKAGAAELTAMAQTATVSDAMLKKYPVIPHGIEKFIARALALHTTAGQGENGAAGAAGEVEFEVPVERLKESASLRLTLAPSMAAAMLDALPYLAEYPYGCVEQTMSRFLPAVVVAKTMRELGLDAKDVNDYMENVLAARKDPQGHPQRQDTVTSTRLPEITKASLNRLYDFQHADGGWGWWKEGDSDRFMTAYVTWGLLLARNADLDVRSDVISRAVQYLDQNLVQEENNPDQLAWMLHALAYAGEQSAFQEKQTARLWDMREKLNPYTRALFAISQKVRGKDDEAVILARNVVNGMMQDNGNQTVHWGEAGVNYRWSEGGVEATAFSLKALLSIDPQSDYIAPAVKWLSLNRRGASWKNTRDTAIAILALADYLKASGELNPQYAYEVFFNDRSVAKGQVSARNMFTFDRYIDLPPEALQDGANKVRVAITGNGALYLSAYLQYFTLEEGITAEGNEVLVTRKYARQAQKETLLKGYVDDWKALADGDTLRSGERVKVELAVEARNNYEYLIFEDPKPAGLEAVELKSGYAFAEKVGSDGQPTGERTALYCEFRDQKAVFFANKLKQGHYRISYELRAEVPGDFHALPDQAHAMYVPEIRANSAENRFKVTD
ncbi:MAG: hypothetical protein HQL20_01715 [Candidatus Omnitrophica bacterium]|nr:hypothetical protein [Candidatus Omnitrophota bacterium]